MIAKFKTYFDKITTVTTEVKKVIHDLLWGTIVIVTMASIMYSIYRLVNTTFI